MPIYEIGNTDSTAYSAVLDDGIFETTYLIAE